MQPLENVNQNKDLKINSLQEINSVQELFKSFPSAKKYDFYSHFINEENINTIKQNILANYPTENEQYDEKTGNVIFTKPNEREIKTHLEKYLSNYTNDPDSVEISYIDDIPIVYFTEESLKENYQSSGAFLIGSINNAPLGIGINTNDSVENNAEDAKHEFAHLATRNISVGSLKRVLPEYDEFYMVTNTDEVNKAILADNFIDEALAYGLNAFAYEYYVDEEFVKESMFYKNSDEYAGFNLKENASRWVEIINQTIEDRSGKKQFKLNHYLIKKVKTIDDIDLTIPETKENIEKLLK